MANPSNNTGKDDRVDAGWADLVARMLVRHTDIAPGKMVSADALTYRGKVFVFRSRRNGAGLGCKLGIGADVESLGVASARPLQPFRGKAPMRGWFVIGSEDLTHWPQVAESALKNLRNELRGGTDG